MDLSLVIGFMVATLALALMPGPDNIYVLTESIARGVKQGIGITTGLISGVIVHTSLVATGLSLLVFKYALVYDAIKYAGAAYLLCLAYGAFKEAPINVEIDQAPKPEPFFRLFIRGFLMNVLNPKVTVFFIAFLPQFVSKGGMEPMWQMFVLGGIFMVISYAVFSSIAIASGWSAQLIKRPKFWVATRWIKVVVLVTLAAFLALSEN